MRRDRGNEKWNILWSDLCMKLIIKSRKRREEEEEEIDLGNAVSLKDIF